MPYPGRAALHWSNIPLNSSDDLSQTPVTSTLNLSNCCRQTSVAICLSWLGIVKSPENRHSFAIRVLPLFSPDAVLTSDEWEPFHTYSGSRPYFSLFFFLLGILAVFSNKMVAMLCWVYWLAKRNQKLVFFVLQVVRLRWEKKQNKLISYGRS